MGLTPTTAAAIKQLAAQEAEQLAPLEAAHVSTLQLVPSLNCCARELYTLQITGHALATHDFHPSAHVSFIIQPCFSIISLLFDL
jgi:hypothetical protein